jgi:hypothetical protein
VFKSRVIKALFKRQSVSILGSALVHLESPPLTKNTPTGKLLGNVAVGGMVLSGKYNAFWA